MGQPVKIHMSVWEWAVHLLLHIIHLGKTLGEIRDGVIFHFRVESELWKDKGYLRSLYKERKHIRNISVYRRNSCLPYGWIYNPLVNKKNPSRRFKYSSHLLHLLFIVVTSHSLVLAVSEVESDGYMNLEYESAPCRQIRVTHTICFFCEKNVHKVE